MDLKMFSFDKYLKRLCFHIKLDDENLFHQASKAIQDTNKEGGKIIIAGNGGSAAIASHVAVDLTKTAGVRALNFNEASLITCLANDYGYEQWVARGIEFHGNKSDLAIMISSSGMSKNIINGSLSARNLGMKVITFSGFKADNELRGTGDMNFWVDSSNYNIVETTHEAWLLAIIEKLAGHIL